VLRSPMPGTSVRVSLRHLPRSALLAVISRRHRPARTGGTALAGTALAGAILAAVRR
jgi:hypothetical protein